jgi:ribosomal protein S12 methylthiotransferase
MVSGKYIADYFRKSTHTISVDSNVHKVIFGDGVFPVRSKSSFTKAFVGKRGKNKIDLKLEEHVFVEEEDELSFDHHGQDIKFPFKINSKTIENLVIESKKLAEKGIKELILIAQDLTYYGLDIYKKRALADLLKELIKIDGIEWVRLHYAFPTGFPLDVLEVIKNEPKVCNYLDIPLQHINSDLLKSMKRGTTSEKTRALVKEFRNAVPNMAIRTTMIVGYPGETEEIFKELKAFIKESKFDRLGCFTYSHEEDTSAYLLEDNIPEEVKEQRVAEIMEMQAEISFELNQQKVGKVFKCIFDRKEGSDYIGRTEFDSPDVDNEVIVDATKHFLQLGQFIDIEITEATDFDLYGVPVTYSKIKDL